MLKLREVVLLTTLAVASITVTESGAQYCDKSSKSVSCNRRPNSEQNFIFYDVNKWEGFNLRRDVYMRFAIMLADAQESGKRLNYNLVLSPWHGMYHWQEDSAKTLPWRKFFDISKLQTFTSVVELDEIMEEKHLEIDVLFVLHNYIDAFEGGTFQEKWDIFNDEDGPECVYEGKFWGVANITFKEILCIRFQGRAAKLWELIPLHSDIKTLMFANAEIVLHDNYGTKKYWECRKSMVFNQNLIKVAENFITDKFNCKVSKCDTYIAVHVRRNDFVSTERKIVPSIKGTASQVRDFKLNNNINTTSVFIATDSYGIEKDSLFQSFVDMGLRPVFFEPDYTEIQTYTQGGIAIIEQIICSHAQFFIGTHESTFTFRIQEEREILGFDSNTTFNRLCPDKGSCEPPSRWTIIH